MRWPWSKKPDCGRPGEKAGTECQWETIATKRIVRAYGSEDHVGEHYVLRCTVCGWVTDRKMMLTR